MQIKSTVLKLVFLLNLVTGMALAQPAPNNINTLVKKIGNYNTANPAEKVFLHLDKPYYSTDDTVWFKGYLMSPAITYSPLSSRLYIELLNDSNAVIKRFVFPVGLGLTWGSIPLNSNLVHEGTYTLRAYTNWMRNFGDDYFFKQSFYVNNKGDNTWLVNVRPTLDASGGKDNVKLQMKFSSLDDKSAGLRDMNLRVMNGKKVLLRSTAQTGSDGVMDVDFTLPPQTKLKNLSILAQDKEDKTKKILIPIAINRAEDIDVQFMPEGGSLVASIPTHVGFKATGEDGKGIAVQGSVYDNNHNEIAKINTVRYGIGTFDITPQPNTTYSAEISIPGGGKKIIALPVPLKTGSILRIRNGMDKDTMTVSAYNTAEDGIGKYYLIGMARGVVCYGASLTFNNNFFTARVAKSLFPTGIAHFILLNSAQQPINERITFINHDDNLKIDIKTDAQTYGSRDSIPVHFTVKDSEGKPVVGSFSMAVTDDNQVKPGSAADDNIMSHLLLASDLKGYVEDPTYYFEHTDQSWKALDALLLTQGWVGYDLKKINLPPVKPAFVPEVEFAVNGTVTNLFNKPVSNSKVLLLAKGSQNFVKDTVTNKDGRFTFNQFPLIRDKSTFIITARNARGKVVNGGISVDEKNQSPVNTGGPILLDPWNVNTDTTLLNYVRSNKSYHASLDRAVFGTTGRLLRAVNIKDQAYIKGSQNLNGAGSADQTLDEETMVNAGRSSLLDVIMAKVKGFHQSFYKPSTFGAATRRTTPTTDSNASSGGPNMEYFIKDKRVHFVFDGIDLDRFYEPFGGQANEHYEYQKQYLDYISAEDILGVEVIYSNNGNYNIRNIDNTDDLLAATPTGGRGSDFAYLEITTRAGNGPFIQRATGIYIYKPLPLAEYKQFYKPKYAVKTTVRRYEDLRSTIHWEPNIITSREGTATVSFYSADKPTHYTIIFEGADMAGKVGYQTNKITIGGNTQ